MADVGLRSCEVLALCIRDVNMQTCRIAIRESKHGASRMVWCAPELRDLIGAWLEIRPESSHDLLFVTASGRPVGRQSLYKTVTTAARRAKIDWSVSPHALRHTFATRLYRQTKDIRLVQKALGHANLSTTMIYTHVVDDDLQDAMVRLHA